MPLEKKSIHAFKASARDSKNRVEEVHHWLFVLEGGHFDSVETLMINYYRFVRDLGRILVDRTMLYGGLGLHPRLITFLWTWTPEEFVF